MPLKKFASLLPLLLIPPFVLLSQTSPGPLPWLWLSTDGKTSGWNSSAVLGQVPIVGIPCVSQHKDLSHQLMARLPNGTCLPIVLVSPTGETSLQVEFSVSSATLVLNPETLKEKQ